MEAADPSIDARLRHLEDVLGAIRNEVLVGNGNSNQTLAELERRLRTTELAVNQANTLDVRVKDIERWSEEATGRERKALELRRQWEQGTGGSVEELMRRIAEVEDLGRKQAIVLSTGFESDKAEKSDKVAALEVTLQRQQQAIDTLTEALREERANRLALEEFTRKEIDANTSNDELALQKSDTGVRAVQKDLTYLEQILRAEVKARLQLSEETKERTDSLVTRVAESGRAMIRQLETQMQHMDDNQRTVNDDLKRWVSKHTAESSQQHFRAVADHEVVMMELRKNIQELSTDHLMAKQHLEAGIHNNSVALQKSKDVVQGELQGQLGEVRTQLLQTVQHVANSAEQSAAKLKNAMHRTRDKVNVKLAEQARTIAELQHKNKEDLAHVSKTFEGAMRKLKSMQDNHTTIAKQAVDSSAQQLFTLIDTVRSSSRAGLEELAGVTESHFEKHVNSHMKLHEQVETVNTVLTSKINNDITQERSMRQNAAAAAEKKTRQEFSAVRSAASVQSEDFERRVIGVENLMASELTQTKMILERTIESTWEEAETALRGLQLEVDHEMKQFHKELDDVQIALHSKIDNVESVLSGDLTRAKSVLTETIEATAAEAHRETTELEADTTAKIQDLQTELTRVEEQGMVALNELSDVREAAAAALQKEMMDVVQATQDEAQAAVICVNQHLEAELENVTSAITEGRAKFEAYADKQQVKHDDDLRHVRKEFDEADQSIRVWTSKKLEGISNRISHEVAWIQDFTLLQEEEHARGIDKIATDMDNRIRRSEHEVREEVDGKLQRRAEELDKWQVETRAGFTTCRNRMDQCEMGILEKLEGIAAQQDEERKALKTEIEENVHAMGDECEAAVLSLRNENEDVRNDFGVLQGKQEEDVRQLEQNLERGIEVVHNDCAAAVQHLKSTLEENSLRMNDHMTIHEEQFETRVSALEAESHDYITQIQARIDATKEEVINDTANEIGTVQDNLSALVASKEREAISREEELSREIKKLTAHLEDLRDDIDQRVDRRLEGMKKVVAESFEALKEALDAEKENRASETAAMQHTINERFHENVGKQDRELEKLRKETADNLQGTRDEFESAVLQLSNADTTLKEDLEQLRKTVTTTQGDLRTELDISMAEMQGALQTKMEENAKHEEDERNVMQDMMLEDNEATKEEMQTAIEALDEKLKAANAQIRTIEGKHEQLEKVNDDNTQSIEEIEGKVKDTASDQSKAVEGRLDEMEHKCTTGLDSVKNNTAQMEQRLSLLQNFTDRLLGTLGQSAGDDVEEVPARDGEIQEAIKKLSLEMSNKLEESSDNNEAKRRQLHDDITKEREASEKQLREKVDAVHMTSLDACLKAEEEAQQRMDQLDEMVKLEQEKTEGAVNERSDGLEKAIATLTTSVNETLIPQVKVLEEKAAEADADRNNTRDNMAKIDTRLTDVETKLKNTETAEETVNIEQKLAELEGKVATRDFVTELVNEKDDFRRQYIDDALAKAKEESLDGDKSLKEELSQCISQDAVNNLINEKDKELREYVDSKAGG